MFFEELEGRIGPPHVSSFSSKPVTGKIVPKTMAVG